MSRQQLKEILETLLKQDPRLTDASGELNAAMIRDLTDKTDEQLIDLLLSNEEIKKRFFIQTKAALIFKQNDLKFFLDANKIDNSYTAYENKIGLSNGSRLLKDYGDVVLNFPYKDCILEGGQSTEEGTDLYYEYDGKKEDYGLHKGQRREIFFNEVLAQDEIDRLLERKAFCNMKRHTAQGEEPVGTFARDKDGKIAENLIIKGNNLLALHSLKEKFTAGIKMIYIDPPYYFRNVKQEDTFVYNSNFRLSTWLAFMRSRLEAAQKLMKEDGVIFVSINEDGLAYLKILMDEIFKIDNFIEVFSWKKTDTPSNLPHKSKKALEYILCYEKKKDNVKYKGIVKTSTSNDPLTKPKNSLKTISFKPGTLIFSEEARNYPQGKNYGTEKYPMTLLDDLIVQDFTNANTIRFENRFIWVQDNFDAELEKGTKIYSSKNSLVLSYKKQSYEVEAPFDLIDSSMGIQTSENAGKELTSLFGKEVFKYPKSESLIEYLVNMVSNKLNKNDYILDFHLGSGTTAAVAHKMGYRYIGIEQMDYIDTLSIPRLQKVIAGDGIGISEKLSWKGGGSFISMELKKWNEEAKEKILSAKTLNELETLLDELADNYFLNYNVKLKEFREVIIREENFRKLWFKKQQAMFLQMLDLNQLYVNASEMEDTRYGLSAEEIALTTDFYK